MFDRDREREKGMKSDRMIVNAGDCNTRKKDITKEKRKRERKMCL